MKGIILCAVINYLFADMGYINNGVYKQQLGDVNYIRPGF
ncbi:hypothetical protein SPPR111872_25120 [Sphingobacterium prati]